LVKSVAQLGTRLHALLDPRASDAVEQVNRMLNEKGVRSRVELVRASLEDVFVAATGFNSDRARAA
jgi:ABC-2 type transport system ATP-binding protein